MCIIVYKKPNVQVPNKKTLKKCWEGNQDGAGYAWFDSERDTWGVVKGLGTWKSFWKSFNKNRFTEKDHLIVHFRIGTSGKKGSDKYRDFSHPDCTHPFPISDKDEDLFSHEYYCKSIVAHNGVVGSGEGDLSDSMLAIKLVLSALYPYREDKKIMPLMKELLKHKTNRWVFTSSSEVTLLGDWITDKDTNIMYSKDTYKDKPKTNYTSAYNNRVIYGTDWWNKEKDIPVQNIDVHKTMFFKKKEWDWKIYDFIMKEDKLKKKEESTEIFDFQDNVIATVSSDGKIEWSYDYKTKEQEEKLDLSYLPSSLRKLIEEKGEDHEFSCTNCGQELQLLEINTDGSCPYCETVIVPLDAGEYYDTEQHYILCPLCKKPDYVVQWLETQFECLSCEKPFQFYEYNEGDRKHG